MPYIRSTTAPRSVFVILLLFGAMWASEGAQASPQFAREHQVRCTRCHLLPPALNEEGLAFQANGYRLPNSAKDQEQGTPDVPGPKTIPMAAWITARLEDQGSQGASDLFLPKVELISGKSLSDTWSYFVEWRIVSLSLNSDGSLKDRGGRFEDLFFDTTVRGRHSFKIGQYRSLNQVDVSLRLSPSEPQLFKNNLRTGTHTDPRSSSLDHFSPSSRSPSLGYAFRSIEGPRQSDGLFHYLILPFVGELSIPLSSEASQNASFELWGPPKGMYLETFYRRGFKSVGGHGFYSDDAWLLTALGTYDWRQLILTAGIGVDDTDEAKSRQRGSAQIEYFFLERSGLRAAPGVRVEDVSEDGKSASWIPYFALSVPNTTYTLLFQLQYQEKDGNDSFVFDVSVLF